MTEILSLIFNGVIGGGATGLLGVIIQKWFSLSERRLDLQMMDKQFDQAMALSRQEQEARERLAKLGKEEREAVTDMEMTARSNESADRLMAASYEHDTPRYISKDSQEMPPTLLERSRLARFLATASAFLSRVCMLGVDLWRGIIRPGLTTYIMWMLTLLFYWVRDLYSKSQIVLTQDQVWELTKTVIMTITYLGTAIPLWWFGLRGGPSDAKK